MAPEVVLRKLQMLRRLLTDLEPFADVDQGTVTENHYVVERILELLSTVAADLLAHLVAERAEPPSTYRETFRAAGEVGLIPPDLAGELEQSAAMRNVLVHLYEKIDYEIVHAAIPRALRDYRRLIAELEPYAREGGAVGGEG